MLVTADIAGISTVAVPDEVDATIPLIVGIILFANVLSYVINLPSSVSATSSWIRQLSPSSIALTLRWTAILWFTTWSALFFLLAFISI